MEQKTTPIPILAHLTPSQQKAVTTTEGPLLIIAGAGSGKTRVITQRIAYLLSQGISPEQILAITFTNKAAGEMKERVCRYTQGEKVWVSTFHAFCARILRRHAEILGYTRHYLIYDTDDKKALIQTIITEKKLNIKHSLGKLGGEISSLKRKVLYPNQTYAFPAPLDEIFPLYEKRLKLADAMDFEDLLINTVRLFENAPEILNHYQNHFRYLLVDEYQDTNDVQASLVFLLGEKHRNVCVCGDPNQSIYAFRGARIENILKFNQEYPQTEVIKLEQNFRSTQNILTAASELVSYNEQKSDHFKLFSTNETGSLLTLYVCPNEKAEASLLAQKIQEFCANGYSLKDIAVFYRVNAQSRNIESALILHQIPYQVVGGTHFYQRKEIKDLLAYLRFSINPADEMSLHRILNTPPRGIGKTTLARIQAFAQEEEQNLFWGLQHAARTKINKRALSAIENFLRLIEELKHHSNRIYDALAYLLEEINYRHYLSTLEEHSSVSREANVEELLQAALEFEQTYPDQCGIAWFLEETALVSDIDEMKENEEEDRVTLMTLHSSKGLEFPVVLFAGLEEGLLPHSWSMDSYDQIQEERRLCYVGLTRAKKEIVLTCCETRAHQGFSQMSPPSPFLKEIPSHLLQTIHLAPGASFHSEEDFENRGAGEDDFSLDPSPHLFRSGELVRHPNLGYGKILRLHGPKKDKIATIKFIDGSEKQIRLKFAHLEKADWSDLGETP